MKKKKKKKERSKYESLFKKILYFPTNYWIPNNNELTDVETNSWFTIKESKSIIKNPIIDSKIKIKKIDKIIKCEKIIMQPSKKQKTILLIWLKSYIQMYNETIKLIKQRRYNNLPIITSWKILRTSYLKPIKDNIIKQSNNNSHKYNTYVNSHVLDSAIQNACTSLQSCLTNLKNKHIMHFRLRYLKQSKTNKIMKIESQYINPNKNTFCTSIFKEDFILKKEDKSAFQLNNVTRDFTIHHSSKFNEFTLLNPIKVDQKEIHKNKDTISLDPGIRSFQTGFSNNKCVHIGCNLVPKLKKYIIKIDKINNNENIDEKIKKKIEQKCYKKIENAVDDMHWKTINYLTNNFGNILIGNLSTKSIVSNNSKTYLNKVVKRVSLLMRLYKFKQRLIYKCNLQRIGYAEIDEAYTSKTCSNCGFMNDNLGASKIFKCNICELKIDRDCNGARNIMINCNG